MSLLKGSMYLITGYLDLVRLPRISRVRVLGLRFEVLGFRGWGFGVGFSY